MNGMELVAILNSWNKVNSDRKKETVQTYNDQKQ